MTMSEDKTSYTLEQRVELRLTRDLKCPRCSGAGIVDWKGAGNVMVLRALCECVETLRE